MKKFGKALLWESLQNFPVVCGLVLALGLWETSAGWAVVCAVVGSVATAVAIALTERKLDSDPEYEEPITTLIFNAIGMSVFTTALVPYQLAEWSTIASDILIGGALGAVLGILQYVVSRRRVQWLHVVGQVCAGSACLALLRAAAALPWLLAALGLTLLMSAVIVLIEYEPLLKLKELMSRIWSSGSSVLTFPESTDPDIDRRRRLLNILLAGTAALAVIQLLFGGIYGSLVEPERTGALLAVGGIALVGVAIMFLINRYGAQWLAGILYLTTIAGIIVVFEVPEEVADGRSLVVFMIPIAVSALLLRPWVPFAAAAVSSVTIFILALNAGIAPNPFAMVSFFTMAIISWLAARSLVQSLADLNALNVELDQRVEQRTGELRAILDSTADGIIVFDNEGKITMVNPALANLVVHTQNELVGRDIADLMETDVNPDDQEMVMGLLQNREMEEPSVKIKWGDKVFSVSMAPVSLESGEEIGTVAVFRDFTREAQIDRMKSTFVGIASHELRTPLNAIMGYAEMLNEGIYGELTNEQVGALKRILANSQHMHSLASNLLDRAQIEAGTMELTLTEFPPAEMLEQAIIGTEVLASNKQLSLTSEVSSDLPKTVTGDRQRLNQVVVNLIGNAIKFTDSGGIHVSAYSVDGDAWYAIAITDTGIGIPEEAQEYIFEPFRQADDSATREHGGVGLGLSVVKQLVEMMGGRVELESEIGKGSTFTIMLPTSIEEDVLTTST